MFDLKDSAARTQESLNSRQFALEQVISGLKARVDFCEDTCRELQTLFDRDYKEFVRDRKRWKTDFDNAQKQAVTNVQEINESIRKCVQHNAVNTKIMKHLCDAHMIAQLCEKQDVEDKK